MKEGENVRLCYNSLLLTINHFYINEITLTDLNDMLFRSVDEEFKRTSEEEFLENRQGYASELKRAKIDIPNNIKKVAKNKTYKEILYGVKKHCTTLLAQPNNHELMSILNQLVVNQHFIY